MRKYIMVEVESLRKQENKAYICKFCWNRDIRIIHHWHFGMEAPANCYWSPNARFVFRPTCSHA